MMSLCFVIGGETAVRTIRCLRRWHHLLISRILFICPVIFWFWMWTNIYFHTQKKYSVKKRITAWTVQNPSGVQYAIICIIRFKIIALWILIGSCRIFKGKKLTYNILLRCWVTTSYQISFLLFWTETCRSWEMYLDRNSVLIAGFVHHLWLQLQSHTCFVNSSIQDVRKILEIYIHTFYITSTQSKRYSWLAIH